LIEEELLLPIALSRDVDRFGISWSGNYIINPFKLDSSELIHLDKYPLACVYLSSNAYVLRKRYVAMRNPSNWYRTIDRIYPELVKLPKLLIRDLNRNGIVAFDKGMYYPHHNLTYISGSSVENIKVLGALLSSTFYVNQLASVSVKVHSGYVRWQVQNLRKIFLPEIKNISQRVKKQLVTHFDRKDKQGIDDVVENHIHRRWL
jgi:hypothetical protein